MKIYPLVAVILAAGIWWANGSEDHIGKLLHEVWKRKVELDDKFLW